MSNAILRWITLFHYKLIEIEPRPTVQALYLKTLAIAMYDTWTYYDNVAQPVYNRATSDPTLVGTRTQDIELAIIASAYTVSKRVLNNNPIVDQLLIDQGYWPTDITNSSSNAFIKFGVTTANKTLFELDQDDYLHNLSADFSDNSGYIPVNNAQDQALIDPEQWKPTPGQTPVTPHWRYLKPFALSAGSDLRPSGYTSINAQINQFKDVVGINANLTETQKLLAEYFNDMILQVGNVLIDYLQKKPLSLAEQVKAFLAFSCALYDVGIAAWDAKYFYDKPRPITTIRYLFPNSYINNLTPNKSELVQAKDWRPYLSTPAHPELVSGHAAFSYASLKILGQLFGANHKYSIICAPGKSKLEPGYNPSEERKIEFNSLLEIAEAASASRIYGGIHIQAGCDQGRVLGQQVADIVLTKCRRLWSGSS